MRRKNITTLLFGFGILITASWLVACGDATPSESNGTVEDATSDASAAVDGEGAGGDTASPDGAADVPAASDLPVSQDVPNVDVTPDANAPDVVAPRPDTIADVPPTPDAGPDTPTEPDVATQPDVPTVDTEPPSEADPFAQGPHAWTTETETVQLAGGGLVPANATLTIYVPEIDGPTPVIIFSHGFQLSPSDYASYGAHLASWGMTVVFPTVGGFSLTPRTHVELKNDIIAYMDWVDGNLQASSIGLAGHSLGGKTSIFAASEDARPAAVFGIDPVDAAPPITLDPTGYPSVTPELVGDVSCPMVLLGETTNSQGDGFAPACAPADENFHQYFIHAAAPALEIEVLGANHMSFLDNPNCGFACSACPAGTDDPAKTRSLTRGYMTAFFLVELAQDTAFQSHLTGDGMQDDVDDGLVTTATANGYP